MKIRKANFKIEMIATDKTAITVFCSTELQMKHICEMFKTIKEKGVWKYNIRTEKI